MTKKTTTTPEAIPETETQMRYAVTATPENSVSTNSEDEALEAVARFKKENVPSFTFTDHKAELIATYSKEPHQKNYRTTTGKI